jgi:exopolysaccharide production protein ExoZ
VQYLRAVAALLVVFHHVRNPSNGGFNPIGHWNFGQAGVDMFFIISDYIMLTVAREARPLEFLRRRIVRIVPLYWLATSFLLFEAFVGFSGVLPSVEQLLKSLFFVPQFHPAKPTEIWPFLIPGWTLQFEMYFYAMFAIGLATRRVLSVTLAIGIFAVALGWIAPVKGNAIHTAYTSPIILEFFAGMLIAHFHRANSLGSCWLALPVGVIALGVLGNLDLPRLIMWGVPTLLIFVGTLALEDADKLPHMPRLTELGDASYSIYLSHIFTIHMGLYLWLQAPIQGWPQFLIFMPSALIGCAFIGVLIYRFVEKPMLNWFQRHR